MQATGWALTQAGQPLETLELELSTPAKNEVLIQVKGCGVCHTDLSYIFEGVPLHSPTPRILGHEIVGVVIEAGDDHKTLLGESVIVPAVIPCGTCAACLDGRPSICPQQVFLGNDIHGGFSSHVRVPAPQNSLCVVPKTYKGALTDLAVVADAVTTPLNAVHKSGLRTDDTPQVAVVVGAGGIGAFALQIAKSWGENVHTIALDISDQRLHLVEEHGADLILNTHDLSAQDVKKFLRAHAKQKGWPTSQWTIFETSGTTAGQDTAFNLLNFGATLMVVGYTAKKTPLRLSNLMAFDARAVGVWGCPPSLYPKAVELIMADKVALKPFVQHEPLSRVNEIITDLHHRRISRRVILVPEN